MRPIVASRSSLYIKLSQENDTREHGDGMSSLKCTLLKYLFNNKRRRRIKTTQEKPKQMMKYVIDGTLLKGATPAGEVCRCHTYLLCRLQNRLWTTAPGYRIYDNRLPVNLGKERTITTGFQIHEDIQTYQII